ncbi:hypothetical protein ASPBRDRAFT_191299 [Aspergillus brasiliensis CBS 101740]|uniref:AAA+ ATPase lid domain-containing protein n=1 Tax=Aspergillus brasiliensis (strain CBS 101740 / IMI 381727 / IBT 21946) TaxID=767769 RepID=A0A1L9V2A5_ASPBC|nr:hypothetical protein ASPBRDRAFT_191299 [Aspergillus brasiliensis CBS 101740]
MLSFDIPLRASAREPPWADQAVQPSSFRLPFRWTYSVAPVIPATGYNESIKQLWLPDYCTLIQGPTSAVLVDNSHHHGSFGRIIGMGENDGSTFQTAVALDEYLFHQQPDKSKEDGSMLDQRDFEQVCNMLRDSKQYSTTVHGIDEKISRSIPKPGLEFFAGLDAV